MIYNLVIKKRINQINELIINQIKELIIKEYFQYVHSKKWCFKTVNFKLSCVFYICLYMYFSQIIYNVEV